MTIQAGLAALRQQHAFLAQGAAHADCNVRAASLSQLRRLCGSADDVALLREHALLQLIGMARPSVSQSVSTTLLGGSTWSTLTLYSDLRYCSPEPQPKPLAAAQTPTPLTPTPSLSLGTLAPARAQAVYWNPSSSPSPSSLLEP